MQILFSNFLKLKNMIFNFFKKNEITGAHVHQIFTQIYLFRKSLNNIAIINVAVGLNTHFSYIIVYEISIKYIG
jgi:hypothetical protein